MRNTPPISTMRLPPELMATICHFLAQPHIQYDYIYLIPLLYVSREWYEAAIPLLYARPYLAPHNIRQYLAAISSREVGNFVRYLDLRWMQHSLKASMTSKLIQRSLHLLQYFIAPQVGFSTVHLPILVKCQQLQVLDLSFVVGNWNWEQMRVYLGKFNNLKALKLLKKQSNRGKSEQVTLDKWPAHLERIELIGSSYLTVSEIPSSLHSVTVIEVGTLHTLDHLFITYGAQITELTIISLPSDSPAMVIKSQIFHHMPNLCKFTVQLSHLRNATFELPLSKLRHLRFPGPQYPVMSHKTLQPEDLALVIADDKLPELKLIEIDRWWKWEKSPFMEDLVDLLEDVNGAVVTI
ncbi:F-box protein [Neolecta irregularis DAH-3]|uniref:F-box protein n=1 Tax=Neolecta irregularis (strain DAH-3) TaxID=1198029 RepID=A0A1U7LMY1_NEOID|nr:F-box protein [Neolecta irregularis DAH-3]|eukprot:OLL24030.1 F-box protein [Neolecta irregularis DAH-3]